MRQILLCEIRYNFFQNLLKFRFMFVIKSCNRVNQTEHFYDIKLLDIIKILNAYILSNIFKCIKEKFKLFIGDIINQFIYIIAYKIACTVIFFLIFKTVTVNLPRRDLMLLKTRIFTVNNRRLSIMKKHSADN